MSEVITLPAGDAMLDKRTRDGFTPLTLAAKVKF